jgi:hypothetical protein
VLALYAERKQSTTYKLQKRLVDPENKTFAWPPVVDKHLEVGDELGYRLKPDILMSAEDNERLRDITTAERAVINCGREVGVVEACLLLSLDLVLHARIRLARATARALCEKLIIDVSVAIDDCKRYYLPFPRRRQGRRARMLAAGEHRRRW